jgi:hypothetical protein
MPGHCLATFVYAAGRLVTVILLLLADVLPLSLAIPVLEAKMDSPLPTSTTATLLPPSSGQVPLPLLLLGATIAVVLLLVIPIYNG